MLHTLMILSYTDSGNVIGGNEMIPEGHEKRLDSEGTGDGNGNISIQWIKLMGVTNLG